MAKTKTWRKPGDHPDVKPLNHGDSCLCGKGDQPHGVAISGPDRVRVQVHPGDVIEGSDKSLVVISAGVRYGEPGSVSDPDVD